MWKVNKTYSSETERRDRDRYRSACWDVVLLPAPQNSSHLQRSWSSSHGCTSPSSPEDTHTQSACAFIHLNMCSCSCVCMLGWPQGYRRSATCPGAAWMCWSWWMPQDDQTHRGLTRTWRLPVDTEMNFNKGSLHFNVLVSIQRFILSSKTCTEETNVLL